MVSIWVAVVAGVIGLFIGACMGVFLIALCMANGGSEDNENTGCSSPESES